MKHMPVPWDFSRARSISMSRICSGRINTAIPSLQRHLHSWRNEATGKRRPSAWRSAWVSTKYYDYHIDSCKAADPATVRISLDSTSAPPANLWYRQVTRFRAGSLIGAIPAEALGANIHASISGTVVQVTDTEIVISAGRQ